MCRELSFFHAFNNAADLSSYGTQRIIKISPFVDRFLIFRQCSIVTKLALVPVFCGPYENRDNSYIGVLISACYGWLNQFFVKIIRSQEIATDHQQNDACAV